MPLELFLLDTDTCSYLMQNRHSVVQDRLRQLAPDSIAISAITQGEIWFGLNWKNIGLTRRLAAEAFFRSVTVLDWPANAAIIYGRLRAQLKRAGTDIGGNDVMIAAHAIALGATLVTNNTRHFSRIGPPLLLENWLA
jgi:tRNA(fMet)-specific endonuclease VapC